MHSRLDRWLAIGPLLLIALTLVSCARNDQPGAEPRLQRVVATIPPLQGLIRPLLPPEIEVRPLIGPGQSAHGHRLTPAEVAMARTADVIFAVGLGFEEGALDQFQRDKPQSQQILVFAEVLGLDAGAETHEAHDHEGLDVHLWLDPALAEGFVSAAADLLVARARSGRGGGSLADEIDARRTDLLARIRVIDEEYAAALTPHRGKSVLTQHPAFARMLERYGMHEVPLRRTAGQAGPSAAELADALRTTRERGVAAVFIEPQAPEALPRRLAERAGLPLGTLDPLGAGDWEELMRANLDSLIQALGSDGRPDRP